MLPLLVTAEQLAARLGDPMLRVVDARPQRALYDEGHVAGAVRVDVDRDLSSPKQPDGRGGRHPLIAPASFDVLCARLGIGPEHDVVVYDGASGANAAARFWWMLRALRRGRGGRSGDVALLDGGLTAAQSAGLAIERDAPKIEPATLHQSRGYALPSASLHEVEVALADPRAIVIDVRAANRWRGEVEPFDPIAGRIPGSKNAPYAENLDANGRFRSSDELRTHFARVLGDVAPERAIISCGSGVTACHTIFAMELAGLSGAVLYEGSYSEWCRFRDVAKG